MQGTTARRQYFEQLERSMLEGGGDLEPEARRAVAARAALLSGSDEPPAGAVLESLQPYVDTVVRHAYKVLDRDLDALKAAGLSEDAIFEATVAAALGAALARRERGLAALRGEER